MTPLWPVSPPACFEARPLFLSIRALPPRPGEAYLKLFKSTDQANRINSVGPEGEAGARGGHSTAYMDEQGSQPGWAEPAKNARSGR